MPREGGASSNRRRVFRARHRTKLSWIIGSSAFADDDNALRHLRGCGVAAGCFGFGVSFADDAIAAVTFGGVQALVSALDQKLRGVAWMQHRGPDRDRHASEPLTA